MMLDSLLLAAILMHGCAPHQEIVERLDDSGYSAIAGGVIEDGVLLLEIFVDDAGDWVVLLTRASDRFACVKATGTGWITRETGNPA